MIDVAIHMAAARFYGAADALRAYDAFSGTGPTRARAPKGQHA